MKKIDLKIKNKNIENHSTQNQTKVSKNGKS